MSTPPISMPIENRKTYVKKTSAAATQMKKLLAPAPPITKPKASSLKRTSTFRNNSKPSVRAAITTIAQGAAILSKPATPAIKKAAVDRQTNFINDSLYAAMEALGTEMEIEDPQYIFYFYHTYLKPHLEKQVNLVKSIKTIGDISATSTRFTPLNKHLQVSPDVVEIAEDIRSLAQLKFYKMLIFRIVEATNLALRAAAFKGRVYLKKNFYSLLHSYWELSVHPAVEEEKKRQAEEAEGSPLPEEIVEGEVFEAEEEEQEGEGEEGEELDGEVEMDYKV